MGAWHLWFMGLLASAFGALLVADYALAQYEVAAYLAMFTPAQQRYFQGLPAWVEGLWGGQAVLALFGGLCLLAGLRASVWLLGLSFVSNAAFCLWLLVLSVPSMQSVTGEIGLYVMLASLVLSLLFWLYARGEKQRAEVL